MKKLIIYIMIFLLTGCAIIAEPPQDSDVGNSSETEEPMKPIESMEPVIPGEPEDNSLFYDTEHLSYLYII